MPFLLPQPAPGGIGAPSAPLNPIAFVDLYAAGNGAVMPNGSAYVVFTMPASDGGSPILSFTAKASSGQTATAVPDYIERPGGTHLPTNQLQLRVDVDGLTGGTPVTFQVKATNANGDSAYSAASNSVTPAALASNYISGGGITGPTVNSPGNSIPFWNDTYANAVNDHWQDNTQTNPVNGSWDTAKIISDGVTETLVWFNMQNPLATTGNGMFRIAPYTYFNFSVKPVSAGTQMKEVFFAREVKINGSVTTASSTQLIDASRNWTTNFWTTLDEIYNITTQSAYNFPSGTNTATAINLGLSTTTYNVGDNYMIGIDDLIVGLVLGNGGFGNPLSSAYNSQGSLTMTQNVWNNWRIPLSAFIGAGSSGYTDPKPFIMKFGLCFDTAGTYYVCNVFFS